MKNNSNTRQNVDSYEKFILYGLMVFSVFSILAYYYLAIKNDIVFSRMLQIEAIICIPLFFYSYKRNYSCYSIQTRRWAIGGILFYMGFEIMNTLLFAPIHESMISEVVFWFFFLAMFFMGSSEKYWSLFLKFGLIILLVTVFLSLIELMFSNFSYIRGQKDEDSYLYQIQVGFAPLELLLCYYLLTIKKYKKQALFVIFVFGFYLVLQFMFTKRLPLIRCILIMALLLYVLKDSYKVGKSFLITVLILTTAVVAYRDFVPKEYSIATFERFNQYGSTSSTIEQDERYLILNKAMGETFSSPRKIIFGHGLGGVATGYYYGKYIEVNGAEIPGLSSFEIGSAYLIFKYGIIFYIIMYGYIFILLTRYKKYKREPLAKACWLYLMVFFIMTSFGESFPSVRGVVSTMTLAGVMGYLSYFNYRKKYIVNIPDLK